MKKLDLGLLFRCVVFPVAIVGMLAGACIHAVALTTEAVYIYQGGNPVLQSSDFYDGGVVFNSVNSALGTVPAPATDGHIRDSSGRAIGFIAPSPAASNELP